MRHAIDDGSGLDGRAVGSSTTRALRSGRRLPIHGQRGCPGRFPPAIDDDRAGAVGGRILPWRGDAARVLVGGGDLIQLALSRRLQGQIFVVVVQVGEIGITRGGARGGQVGEGGRRSGMLETRGGGRSLVAESVSRGHLRQARRLGTQRATGQRVGNPE